MICWLREPQDHRYRARPVKSPQNSRNATTRRLSDFAVPVAQMAACYLLLRRYQATDRWLSQALTSQPDERSRDRATYFIWRADSVLHLGDVEQACSLLSQAVPDIAAARSARNHKRLVDINAKLSKYRRESAVQALHEQLRPMIASGA
jgi:hypothetical protein